MSPQAYRQLGESSIPECAPDLLGPCLVCVPGAGLQLNTTNVYVPSANSYKLKLQCLMQCILKGSGYCPIPRVLTILRLWKCEDDSGLYYPLLCAAFVEQDH